MHSSNLINEDDVNKRSAHTIMCHSARTAEKHYMINRLGDAAAKGHKVLAENIKLKETLSTPVLKPDGDDIELIFSKVIANNTSLAFKDTRNLMSERMHLVMEVHNDSFVKQVYKRDGPCPEHQKDIQFWYAAIFHFLFTNEHQSATPCQRGSFNQFLCCNGSFCAIYHYQELFVGSQKVIIQAMATSSPYLVSFTSDLFSEALSIHKGHSPKYVDQ